MSGTRRTRALRTMAALTLAAVLLPAAARPVAAETHVIDPGAVDDGTLGPNTHRDCRKQGGRVITDDSLGATAGGPELPGTPGEGWRRVGTAEFALTEGVQPSVADAPEAEERGPHDGIATADDEGGGNPVDEGNRPVFVTADGAMYEPVARPARSGDALESTDCWPEAPASPESGAGEPCVGCAPMPGPVGPSVLDAVPFPSGLGIDARPMGTDEVFGADGREVVLNTKDFPWRAHVALRNGADATRSFCSGVMIGPRQVLTAGHCFYGEVDGKLQFHKSQSNLRVVFGQRGSGNADSNTPYGKRKVWGWWFPKGWLDTGESKYDFAVLFLYDSTFSPGWLGFTSYSSTKLDGMTINANGYPGHDYDCADSPVNSGGDEGKCAGYLYHDSGEIENVTSTSLYTDLYDSDKGQSGQPVYRFTDDNRFVVGVHTGSTGSQNRSTRVTAGITEFLCDALDEFPSAHFDANCS